MDAPPWLRGSIPPLVTPIVDGAVDLATYAASVDRQVEAGSAGVLVNGTTAEPSLLTLTERNDLVSCAVETAAGRIPVIAATGSQNLQETRALTDHAVAAGADAVLVVTPYYVRPPQDGLLAYYLALTEELELPWLLYHIPGRAGVGVTIDTLEQLRTERPGFVGMKHAVDDLAYVTRARARLGEDFRVFVGLEHLSYPMLAVGACGVMNAVGNLLPRPLVELVAAVDEGDHERARQLHDGLADLNDAVFWEMNPIPIKYLLWRAGLLPTDEHRLPMRPPSAETARRLDALATAMGLRAAMTTT